MSDFFSSGKSQVSCRLLRDESVAAAGSRPQATSTEGAVVPWPDLGSPGDFSELESVDGSADQFRVHGFLLFILSFFCSTFYRSRDFR